MAFLIVWPGSGFFPFGTPGTDPAAVESCWEPWGAVDADVDGAGLPEH